MDSGLDSTLSTLPSQYDTGVRSRSNSNNFADGATFPQTKLYLQTANLSPSSAAANFSHRRQVSDASDFDSLHLAGSPYLSPSLDDPFREDRSHGSISPAALDLDSDRYGFCRGPFLEHSSDPLFGSTLTTNQVGGFCSPNTGSQLPQMNSMDQAYQAMLCKSSSNLTNNLTSRNSWHGTSAVPYEVSDSETGMPLMYGDTYPQGVSDQNSRESQCHLSSPPQVQIPSRQRSYSQLSRHSEVVPVCDSGADVLSQFDYSQFPINQTNYVADPWADLHNAQTSQSLLEPPGSNMYLHTKLEVPDPYLEASSLDMELYDGNESSVNGPHALSRTTSWNSQAQAVHEPHASSTPASPFVTQAGFTSPTSVYQTPFEFISSEGKVSDRGYGNSVFASDQSTGFLQNSYLNQPLQTSDNCFNLAAPNIAINPPTPAHSFITAQQNDFPFPNQPVPIITTTSAPNVQEEGVPTYSAHNLTVTERVRGRSNSDSRLMLEPQSHARSLSHSSQDSSSSSVHTTNSHVGSVLGVDHKSNSTLRISKSGDRSRRASWSGDRGSIDRDLLGQAREHNKQKNPATFICPVEGCQKAFTRAYNLRSHQRTHTDERPFLCEICGKGFARQHDRKRHEKLHTNEKPFTCPGCKKQFARMDALSRHFKSETGKDCIIGNPEYQHFLDDSES